MVGGRCVATGCLVAAVLLVTSSVMAQTRCSVCGGSHASAEKALPYLSGHVDARIHADDIHDAPEEGNEIEWAKAHMHVDLGLYLTEWFRIDGSLKFEEMHDHGGHDHGGGGHHEYEGVDRFFEDHLAMIEELRATFSGDRWELFAGKFTPLTGLNMHHFPGFYGYEVPEEYSLLDRVGVGGAYEVETESLGTFHIELSTFMADTTFLNEGVGEDRPVPHSDNHGGLANTGDLSSFALALEAFGWYANVGDTFHELSGIVSYAHQAQGDGVDEDEHADEDRASVGLLYVGTLSEDLSVRMVAETLSANSFGGMESHDTVFCTFGAGVYWKGWELGGTYTDIEGDEEEDGHHAQASVGYTFDSGFGVHVGIRDAESEGERRQSHGLMLSYHASF